MELRVAVKRPGPLVGSAKLNPGVAQPLLVGIDRSYPSAMLICWRAACEEGGYRQGGTGLLAVC